jgi:ABC-type molybdate transport system substrate-binding protein
LLKAGADDPDARRFFEYLQSPAAAAVFEKFGFIWRPEE